MNIQIVDLTQLDADGHHQAAEILNTVFRAHWPEAWPTMEEAEQEVREMIVPERIARAALADGVVVGWIGGIPGYEGHVWELHPLAVRLDWQRKGVGSLLVCDFEQQVRTRGGLTVMLGSDDEDGMTTLAGADLYTDLWDKIRTIRDLKGHPYKFYEKMGYKIIGVMPDANGRGKPDIYMGKRVE